MASSSEIFSSVVAGKIQNLASTSSRKREKISDISGSSSSILDEVIRNNYLDSVPTRIEQGESSFLNEGTNRVTFQGLDKKGTDADSGYFSMGDKKAGLRALGIDAPETSFYNKESKGRKTQKEHYARLWNVPEDRITDDIIFSMGRRTEEAFDIVASKGQQGGDIVADATYDPTSLKWSTDKRTKATVINPFTGTDIYGAMNTPEFNTRWFKDTPEQNEIRAKYEAEHGNDYSRFKMPNEGKVVGTTQHGKPAFYLNGEIVSEKSTTLQVGGKWVNVPTIWDGKQYSDDEVAVMLARGDIEPTSVHKSEKEAGIAAKARSQQIDYGQNEKSEYVDSMGEPITRKAFIRHQTLVNSLEGKDTYWEVFEDSVSSGVDNLQATGYGFAALLADATGNTEFATKMLEHYLSNIDEAQRNSANLPAIEDIDWLGNPDMALRKLVALLGEAMPSIIEIGGVALAAYFTAGAAVPIYGSLRYGAGKGAQYMGKKYVNKQIGKKALQKIKNRSASVGGYMAANVMETGGIYGDVAVAGHRDARAITMSLAGGSAAAALEMFYPLKVLKKMGLGNQGTKALYKSFRKNGAGQVFKVIGKEMAAGGLTEGTTEALQFVIEEATQDLIKNGHLPDMTSSQFLWGMANSFVAGLVPGAAISGSVSTASQLSKQIDGDRKFTDEQTAQILQEAVEAGEATADMTEQELIANEKKLGAAITKIEESEGLNLGDLNVDGMNNLEKAFAYIEALKPTQNEDGTVDAPISTPETEAIKNELITAIKEFSTNDSRVQARKEYKTDGIRLDAEVKAINDKFDALEAKFPDRKEKYDAERARLINIKQRKANNRVEPTNVNQRKTARAETKVVRTTIEKSIKKLNAISRKLKDTNLSKKHRKRLEQERNNLGKHITDLQDNTILSKTSSKQIERTLSSFNFQHKSANLDKDTQLQSDVQAFDTLDKNASNAISALDNEDSTTKEKLDAMNAFFNDYGKALNARDRTIVAIGEATDKVELKNLKKGLADMDAKIAGVEVAYEKTTTYKPAKPSTATAKATDVLYSLLPINDKTLKELKGLKDQLSDTEKELLDAHINLAKTKNTLDKHTNETKNIHQVRDDVLLGTDKQFTGFLSYLKLFEEGKDVISDVNYFIGSLKDKLKVFRKAYNIVKNGGKVWINKETLAIVTTEPARVKNDKGVLVENLDEYWWVTNKSSKLIHYINAEIKFGEAVASLINTSEQLAPGRAKQVKEDEALRQSAELLAKQQQKTQPDTGDLENIEIEETKPKPVVKKQAETVKFQAGTAVIIRDFTKHTGEEIEDHDDFDLVFGTVESINTDTSTATVAVTWDGGVVDTYDIPLHALEAETVEKGETKPAPEVKAPTKEPEKKSTKLEDYINTLGKQIQKVKDEIESYRDKNGKLPKALTYVNQLLAKLDSLQDKEAVAKRQSVVVINNLLSKFQEGFLKIKDSAFTSFDIFVTAHAKRDSFYTRNPLTSLLDKDGGSKVVKEMLKKLKVTDQKFIDYLGEYFLEYRKAFTDTLLEPEHAKNNPNRDSEDGAFTQRTLLNYLYVDTDGVRTLPDEVIFAMMMTSLDWMSINQFNAEVTDKQAIALLLYGDRKHPVTNAEFRQFGNMGILWNNAVTEMGADIFNNLNIKVDSESFNGLKIQELTYDILESIDENGTVIKDPSIGKELQIALGQMALVIASTVHTKNSKLGHDGIVKIHHTKYSHPEFMHDDKLKKLVGSTNLTKKQTIAIEKDQIRRIKTIKFPLLDGTYKDVHGLEDVIETFKSNKKNITLINGTESRLAEPLLSPSKKIQKYVRNSFIALPAKVQKLIEKLQNVEWVGKQEALGLFDLIDDDNMDVILDIQDIETKHDESVEGYKTSNEDKRKDVKQVKDYIKQGLQSFWFKYVAQKQHRVRIDSNGINGQRSKIHRALFMPKSADVLIESELDRALYQVSIAQAFGYGIDKNGLKGSLVEFDRILEVTHDIVALIKAGDVKGPAFNKALAKLLKEGDISPSMHVIEALASLAKHHPTKPFKSAKLGIETDGITNGYAIALMQFYGVPDELLDNGTDEEIAEHLAQAFARVGVMVKPGETMEKFIERGELDVYESLASFIQKTLASKDALTDINAERSKAEGEITKDNLKFLPVIHGDLWDSAKDSISKFGRNLAKNPLMISGYGAQINKIIQNLAADIIPKIYNDIAELQTKYNNAVSESDKAAVVAEATKYEEALSSFIQVGKDKNIPIVAMLKKDELKSFTLDKKQSYTIQKDFKDIFTPAITTALDQFITPLAKARDAIIKSGDIQYRAFKHEFYKALKAQAIVRGFTDTKEYKDFKTDLERQRYFLRKLTLTEQKAIAESLATTYMPLVYGKWSSDDTLIQIIKDIRSEGDAQRNTINFKGQQIQRAVKQGKKFKVVETIERFSVDSSNFQREYVTPSVSAYTNTIQNIDSVILGEALLENPEVLAIFDAIMSNVTDALDNSNEYNEAFRDVALNFSVLEKALERTLAVKKELSKEAIDAVNKDYRENSHEATQLLAQLETIKDPAERAIKQQQIDALGFDTIEMGFHEEVARVARMKNIMAQVFGNEWLENATISQMYLPETLQDIADGTLKIEDVKAETKATKQKTTTTQQDTSTNDTPTVVHKKGAFTKLIKRFDEIKAAIKRDEKASKRFGWISTWYGPVDYVYSGVTHEAQEMPKAFANIARQLEKELGHPEGYFNSALMNIFPKGKGIGKHADDESIYIRDTGTIGSVATISLGGTSEVSIIPNDGTEAQVYNIESGDLYTMPDGDFQVINKHAVGKATAPRISMTFRHIPRSQVPKTVNAKIELEGLRGTNLTPEIIDGFKNAKDAAIQLANSKHQTKYIRYIAKAIIPLIRDDTKISRDFDKYPSPDGDNRAYYSSINNIIVIDSLDNSRILLHELIHAATDRLLRNVENPLSPDSRNLTNRQKNAIKQMFKFKLQLEKVFRADVKNGTIDSKSAYFVEYLLTGAMPEQELLDITGELATDQEKLGEFLTQILTDPWVQNYLKTKDFIGDKTLWNKFTEIVRNLLGLESNTLLDEALSVSLEAIESLQETETVIPEFTPEEAYKLFEDDEGNDVLTNAGQTNAINKMKEWWDSEDKLFVLAGRGGTGKTTIVSKALQELGVDKNRVKFALPTHKAKKVISNATDGYSEDQFTTLASLLGQTKRYDKRTGSFFFARDDDKFASSIRRLQKDQTKLIVIDEVSMVSEQFSDEIVKLSKKLDIRVIFMGDNVQLPPIEDTKGKISLSAVFDNVMGFNQKIDLGINTDHYVKLTERMRQGKDSPILGITDILANTIEYIFRNAKTYDGSPKQVGFVLPIVPENGRQDGVHYAEGTIAGGPTDATIDTFVKEYTKDPANVKYIHFNKESKPRTISIRSRIREKLFPEVENAGDLTVLPFIKGERIVLGESVATVDGNTAKLSTDLHNGDEVTVIQELNEARISVEVGGQYKKTYYGVPVKTLQVKTDSGVIHHLVFEDGKLTKRVIHKQMSEGQQKYNMENKVVAEVTTAEVSAAYLINTHKAQGSTYKTVYIDYENIMGNQGSPDWLTKLSSLYVATSRPSERLVLVGTGDLEFGAEGKDLPENTKIAEDLEQGEVVNKDSDTLGSLDNAVDAEAKEIYRTNSLKTTAQNIFNKLNNIWTGYYPNSQEKEAQASHLQRVLDEIILPTGTALDNTTVVLKKSEIKAQGEVSLGSENVTVHINKYAPNSYSEQTAQEVYLHELIHILTSSKLAKDEKFKSEVTEIRNAVKAELDKMANPYEIFLHKDADGKVIYLTDKDAEIEAAKQQYNYVFGDTMPDEHYLDEFLAYALTNKHLVKQLSSMSANVVPLWDRESGANVVTKIVDLLTEVVTRISNVLNKKSRPANLEMEIFNLTKDMVTVSHERSGTIRHAIRKQQLTKKYDSANEIVSDFLKDAAAKGLKVTSDAYIKGVDKLTKDGKIDNFLANVLYDTKLAALMTSTYGEFVNKHPELQARLDKAFQYFKPNLRHNIAALKADAFGGIDQDFIKLMYKSQKEVDKARVAYKELTEKSLLTAFLDLESLTDNEKDSITRVLLKSDFSVLEASGAYSMEAAIGLLTDGKQLAVEIAKYEDTLDIAGNKHYAVQSSELAKFMMTGKVHNRNQYKNAHMIVKTNPNKRTHQGNKKAEIQDMDVYVTLLALQDASYSPRKDVANVAAREFALDSTHNGITHIIHHHIAFKQESLKTGFNGNPALMTKGYISTITDPDIQIEFAPKDDATQLDMKKKGYIFVDNFEVITGLHDSNYGIYVIKNNPDIMRTKGIASVTSKHHAGTSFKEIIGRNVEAEGQINAVFRKWRKKQTQTQNTLDAHHTMLPIINEEGKIVDYSIHMHHVMMERLLKQKLAFNEVMPTMYSHQQDKVASEKINKEAMDLLYQHTQLNYAKAPHKFVNILDGKYREEYFDVLPRATRNYILYIAKRDNKKNKQIFNVEQKLLDVVFGYKMPSISNTILFSKSFKAQRYAKVVEKLIFETVALAKVAIVIKIPIVPMVNFTSNFVTSMMYGVPPGYLIKKWREGYKELVKYQEDAHKLQLLELDRLGNPKLRNDPQIDKRIKRLTAKLNKNKVAKFIDAGLFNSITEDINQNDFTYRHKAASKIKGSVIGQKFDGLFKGKVLDVANQAYMGEKTATFKTMMHFTQVSDFIARYAMYSYDTEVKNMNKDKAYKQMVETFVNYDQPLNRYLQYGNDSGLLFFVKYWIRIQRATFNLVKEKPLNVGLLWIANGMLDLDIETIMESSVLTGNFFPTEGGIVKVLGEVIIPPGVEILSGEGF